MNKSVQMLNDWAGKDSGLFKNATAFEIEKISTETIRKACFGTPFNPENVKLVSGQKFPDIVADNHFGIEVKTTTKIIGHRQEVVLSSQREQMILKGYTCCLENWEAIQSNLNVVHIKMCCMTLL